MNDHAFAPAFRPDRQQLLSRVPYMDYGSFKLRRHWHRLNQNYSK
jgi:hypothetical protein